MWQAMGCATGATQVREVAEESDSESSDSEDKSSVESKDSNPLNMEEEGSAISGGNRTSESIYKE